MSPTCSCTGSYILVAGVRYSKHFEPSHYSRINKGKKKAKVKAARKPAADESGLAENMTEAQVRAALDAVNQAMQQSGAVKGDKA